MLKFIKNPSKIVKNDAQERSGGDLGKGSVPGQLQEQARDDFWSLLAPLGRFWVILGTPQNPRGRQKRAKKINTVTFRCPGAVLGGKKSFLEGPGTHIDF